MTEIPTFAIADRDAYALAIGAARLAETPVLEPRADEDQDGEAWARIAHDGDATRSDPAYRPDDLQHEIDQEARWAAEGWVELPLGPLSADRLTGTPEGIIVAIDEYRASVPATIPWVVRPLTYAGGVSLIAGPPKAGKSTMAAQIQRCRETGDRLFGTWDVATGSTLLVTEEGGVAVVHKTDGLHSLDVLDRRSALRAGLTFGQVLEAVGEWGTGHPGGLAFIDTLAIWAGIVDENDAGQTTRAIAAVAAVAQTADLAIVLVHHARKSGGDDGEAIRGSGAILATVDIGIELSRVNPGSDERYLDVMGRVILPERFRLDFERSSMTYSLVDQGGSRLAEIEADLIGVPTDGAGLTRNDLHALWRKDPRARADQLVNVGRMRVDYVKSGRQWANRYWSIPPAWTPEDRRED